MPAGYYRDAGDHLECKAKSQIIETDIALGDSLIFYASMLELIGGWQVRYSVSILISGNTTVGD